MMLFFRLTVVAAAALALVLGQPSAAPILITPNIAPTVAQTVLPTPTRVAIQYFGQGGCTGTAATTLVGAGQCVPSGNNSFIVQCNPANGGVAFYCTGPNCQSCRALVQPFKQGECLPLKNGGRRLQNADGAVKALSVRYQCAAVAAEPSPPAAQPSAPAQAAGGAPAPLPESPSDGSGSAGLALGALMALGAAVLAF